MTDFNGTRDNKLNETASERFNFPEAQGKSRLPIQITLLVTAIAGYLRSAGIGLNTRTEPEETLPVRESQSSYVVVPHKLPELPDADTEDRKDVARFSERLEAPGDIYGRYAENVIPFPVARHTLIDSPPFDFVAMELSEFTQPGGQQLQPAQGSTGGNAPGAAPLGEERASPGKAPAAAPLGEERASPGPARRNRAPESGGTLRLNEAVAGSVLLIGYDQLLVGATDADGQELTIRHIQVSEGSIARATEGFVYSSNAAAVPKSVTLIFEITDGEKATLRTAVLPLVRGPMLGTAGADIVAGTVFADQIDAGAGSDLIDGRGGDDFIVGGEGDDHIAAGDGNDVVFAGQGNDVVFGGSGNDVLVGEAGDDRLDGDAGDDVLLGGLGADQISGGEGHDLISGGEGADLLTGDAGADHINGDSGDDVIHDGVGADVARGGDGNDTLVAALDKDADIYEGGDGNDLLDYSNVSAGLYINLVSGQALSSDTGDDAISGFEMLVGGSGNDVFTVGGQEMRLTGGDGEDMFIFEVPEAVDRPTLIHDILDFVAGDRIRVADFEFSMDERDGDQDRFEQYYRDAEETQDLLELRIRHRHDENDGDLTVFEFDGDGDFSFEMTVTVHGHHQPYVYETLTA